MDHVSHRALTVLTANVHKKKQESPMIELYGHFKTFGCVLSPIDVLVDFSLLVEPEGICETVRISFGVCVCVCVCVCVFFGKGKGGGGGNTPYARTQGE